MVDKETQRERSLNYYWENREMILAKLKEQRRLAKERRNASLQDALALIQTSSWMDNISSSEELKAYINYKYYKENKKDILEKSRKKRLSMSDEEKEKVRSYAREYYVTHKEELANKRKIKRTGAMYRIKTLTEEEKEAKIEAHKEQMRMWYQKNKEKERSEEEKTIIKAKRAAAMRKYRAALKLRGDKQ